MPTFTELGLDNDLLEAISRLGFEKPTPIQEAAIPKIIDDNTDLIALAQTGTGKTGAFGLGCLQKVDLNDRTPQVLILAPTRELALQTAKEIKKFSKKKKALKSVALYGGTDYGSQRKALKNGCQIVVGTPGRTLDFIRQGKLDVRNIRMVVLDEADEMLKMGFQEDLESILENTPDEKQSLLFSATMPKGVERMAMRYLKSPERIEIGERNAGISNVSHHYYLIHHSDRLLALKRVVDASPEMYGIVFCRTRLETTDLSTRLRKDGYHVDVLNGDLSQEQRDRVMNRFHRRELKLLIATDVAARGLDVNDLTHVINFNLPDELPVYVHRTGRTGRAGRSGLALSLVSPREKYRIRHLQRMVGQPFEARQLPTNQEIMMVQLQAMSKKIETVNLEAHGTSDYAEFFIEQLDTLSPEELIQKMTVLLCGTILSSYSNAPEIQQPLVHERNNRRGRDNFERGARRNERGARRNERGDGRFERGNGRRKSQRHQFDGNLTRCEINIGRQNRLTPNRLMGLVNDCFDGPKPHFGKINIFGKRAVFDIDSMAVKHMISETRDQCFEGRDISINVQQAAN